MRDDILSGGLDELRIIKQKLIDLKNYKSQKMSMDSDEANLLKSISNKEKTTQDEIDKVIHQRRSQIESSYDEQISILSTQQKKVLSEKEKTKRAAVAERIDSETAELRHSDQALKLDGRSIFKQESIPFIYNNRLFFALFSPSNFGDFGIILLTLVILLFIIPFGIYYIWFFDQSVLYLALFYIAVIIVFGGLYLIIGKTKHKHQEALDRVREIRQMSKRNRKIQKRMARQITKDKNENGYGLDEYSQEIEKLQSEIRDLLEQKKIALAKYDNIISNEVREEIQARNKPEMDKLKADYKKISDMNRENQDRLNALAIQITNDYEGYISKALLTVEKIEQMEQLIQSGSAVTIADAAAKLSEK